jgi:hypothetical protein
MKTNELRIGNWVIGIQCDRSEVEQQVDVINMMGDFAVTTHGWSELKPIELKPIPLTEEWMLKCGYKYDGYKYEYYDGQEEKRVFESENGLGDFVEIDGFFLPMPYYFGQAFGENFKLKHVHQLQNLYFALTGEELTIKN